MFELIQLLFPDLNRQDACVQFAGTLTLLTIANLRFYPGFALQPACLKTGL